MYIWIDESYDSKFPGHIVIAALIMHSTSKGPIDQCYSILMKRIRNHNYNCKKGQTISLPEIHENVLFGKGRQYRQVKYWAFNILKDSSVADDLEITAVYTAIPFEKNVGLNENIYYSMVSDLVSHYISLCDFTPEPTYVTMDNIFSPKQRIVLLQKFKNAFPSTFYNFSFSDSAKEKGLQFTDLIAGTIRRYLNSEKDDKRAYEQLQDHFSLALLQIK